MWFVAVTLLMNLVGLLSIVAAFVLLSGDQRAWRSSPRRRGALSMLAAGGVLVVGAQYGTARLLPEAVRQSEIESRLGLVVVAILAALAIAASLLAVGGRLLGSPGRLSVAHGCALAIVVVAVVVVLAAPGPFREVARSAPEISPERQVVDAFHTLFYDSQQTWRTATWSGVVTWQNPNDVWIHQEIISEVKPDVIVETGTAAGGSALLWAMVLEQVNPRGKVITIDIKTPDESIQQIARRTPEHADALIQRVTEAQRLPIWKERIQFLKGSSTDPEIVGEVARRVKGKKVLVILDSLHTRDHVFDELKAYTPLVDVGSYVIVQDTNINGHPVNLKHGPGPMEAVHAFLAGTDAFEADRSRERLLFTMHPSGYLRRVK